MSAMAPRKSAGVRLTRKDLSKDQLVVFESVMSWMKRSRKSAGALLTVGGYAGTGKSSLLGVLAHELQSLGLLVAYVTYTGRASSVLFRKLRESGVNATTLLRPARSDGPGLDGFYDSRLSVHSKVPLCSTVHRLLYRPIIDNKTEELTGWKKRAALDREYDYIFVDEASMLSDAILELLRNHKCPVIAVGDHGQLSPVMGTGNLMQNPDLRLERIHRQAERSPIIALSKHVREGGLLRAFKGWDDDVQLRGTGEAREFMRRAFAPGEDVLDSAVLTWMNKTRVELNRAAREELGLEGAPKSGEPLICLKNEPPIYNGMRGILDGDTKVDEKDAWLLHARIAFPEDEIGSVPYKICGPQMNRKRTFGKLDEMREAGIDAFSMGEAESLFDFGYCFTTHKSQGSSFKHGMVFMDRRETPKDGEYRRWAYTSITRAQEKLTMFA